MCSMYISLMYLYMRSVECMCVHVYVNGCIYEYVDIYHPIVLATERVSVVQGQSYLFPSSLNDLANSSFSSISAQIKIPYGYLLQQLGGGESLVSYHVLTWSCICCLVANSTVPVTTAVYATLDGVLPVNRYVDDIIIQGVCQQ